jgi:hypothetical protein
MTKHEHKNYLGLLEPPKPKSIWKFVGKIHEHVYNNFKQFKRTKQKSNTCEQFNTNKEVKKYKQKQSRLIRSLCDCRWKKFISQ